MRAASTCLLLHVLGKHLSNASDCSVWIIAFDSGKTLAYAKTCFPTWRLLMLARFKKKIIKGLLSVGRKNPSLFLYPYRTPHPQAGDSNQTLPWAHLWSWKFLAWKSPPCWLIEKGGFGGPTWKVEGVLFVFVHRWVGSETAVHSEEPLLKAIIFLNYFFHCRDYPWRFIGLTSWLDLAKWWHLPLSLDRFCSNNKNHHSNIIHIWEIQGQYCT